MKIGNNFSNINFGHKIIVDIGASNPRGTCKVLVKSEDGRDLYKANGYLNDKTDGFRMTSPDGKTKDGGQADFISKLDDVIYKAHRTVLKKAEDGEIQFARGSNGGIGRDKMLSGVAVFVPGTTFTMCIDDRIGFIPNLKNEAGESIVNVDFKAYEKEIKEKGRRSEGIEARQDFELVVTKDLGGAGLAIARILALNEELEVGDYIMGVMTGGGFGSVDIKVKGTKENPIVEFETSESSSYLTGNTQMHDKITEMVNDLFTKKNPKEKFEKLKEKIGLENLFPILGKLGRQGVSVKSHLTAFLKALDLPLDKKEYDKLINLALKVGDARLVSSDIMYISKDDKELYKELKDCKYFKEVKSDQNKKKAFSMNKLQVSPKKIKEARIHTVNDYANAVSLISVNKINDCINKVYLVGPFAQGLNKHIKQNQKDYGAKDLPDLIMQKINTNIDPNHVDLPSTKRLMELYNFEIICDEKVNFPDNTFAGDFLLDKKLEFTPNRGSWFSIPLKTLAEKD